MNASQIAGRIHCNLAWSATVGAHAPFFQDCKRQDVWSQITALWQQPDDAFVQFVYLHLLRRPADLAAQSTFTALLADGMPRSLLVRRLAHCAEAKACGLDVSWVPRIDDLEGDAVWECIEKLWDAPDRIFVEGLYPLLFGRPADAPGALSHCTALAGGGSRAALVRNMALSAEARACGLNAAKLLQCLSAMPQGTEAQLFQFSLGFLKGVLRRWLAGWQIGAAARRTERDARLQAVATVEEDKTE